MPSLSDARFGIGLYKYYAAIAPAFARFFRFLFLLPGGNREEGLSDMEAVHARGVLLRGEADYQLHWIYLWYEQQPQRALDLLRALAAQYPANPHFVERIAETEDRYLHDPAASLKTWQAMVDRAPQMGDPRLAATMGRHGRRRGCWMRSYETDRAVEELRQVIDSAPIRTVRCRGRGTADARTDARIAWAIATAAVLAYNAALDAVPAEDPPRRLRRRRGLAFAARRQIAAAAQAYRLSLTGWRAFERGALEQAGTSAGGRGHGGARRRDDSRAARTRARRAEAKPRRHSRSSIGSSRCARQAPPAALGAAYLWSAELLEQQGRKDIALARYRAVSRIFGTDSRLTAAAAAAIARLAR